MVGHAGCFVCSKRGIPLEVRHYDEMRAANGEVRAHFRALADWLAETPADRVAEKRREADLLFHRVGITFAVYGDEAGAERLIPFDTIPRVLPWAEGNKLRARHGTRCARP